MQFLKELKRVQSNPLLTESDINWDFKRKRSIMFPSVIDMSDILENPIDQFYMYLASHGGREIGLATAPDPEGPWTMSADPVLHLDRCPAIEGHLSSPEVVHHEGRIFLYFHGNCPDSVLEDQNRKVKTHYYRRIQNTGVALSKDGLNFEVHQENLIFPIQNADHWGILANQYLRVIVTRDGFHGFYMTMTRDQADHNARNRELPKEAKLPHQTCIGHAWSADGLTWERDSSGPLLLPDEEHGEHSRIRHCGVAAVDEFTALIVYTSWTSKENSNEAIFAASVNLDGKSASVGARYGEILPPEEEWERPELRDPFPLFYKDRFYLYYDGAKEKSIGLAIADTA